MKALAVLEGVKQRGEGVELKLLAERDVLYAIQKYGSRSLELDIRDPRLISPQQRKKIYAMFYDISLYTGYPPDDVKELMKSYYIERTGKSCFSLAGCSMDTARQFLNIILDFALINGIPLREPGFDRTDDITCYLVSCIIHKKCCICGREGETHHLDAIGMGQDRRVYDDSENGIIQLCRNHHILAHTKGVEDFCRMYHVYGVKRRLVEEIYQRMCA